MRWILTKIFRMNVLEIRSINGRTMTVYTFADFDNNY